LRYEVYIPVNIRENNKKALMRELEN